MVDDAKYMGMEFGYGNHKIAFGNELGDSTFNQITLVMKITLSLLETIRA